MTGQMCQYSLTAVVDPSSISSPQQWCGFPSVVEDLFAELNLR